MKVSFNCIQPQRTIFLTPVRCNFNTGLKTDVVSFCGTKEDLLLQDDKTIIKNVKKAIRKENSIGRGGEAEVYKIPNTKYCVRVPHDSFDKLGKVVDKNISPQEIVNHTVAKLANGVSIMPIIDGFTFCSKDITNEKVAKMVEQMPQSAFNKLLKQVCEAYNYDMAFDTGWKNIIINPVNKTLTAIDFVPADDVVSGDRILNKVYLSLTNNPDTTLAQRKICAGKFLTALADNLAPDKSLINDAYALDMGGFARTLKSHKLFSNNFEFDILKSLLVKIEDLKVRELSKSFNPAEFTEQLNTLKNFIKQVF